jgi:hypothetical protein
VKNKFSVVLSVLVAFVIGILAASGIAVAGDKETVLPAGGGDPGKAYMEYMKAMTAGDMAALKKLVSTERAKEMDAPEFKEMFPLIQSMMAKNVKVTGGTMTGNTATLNCEGTDSMGGGASKGTISMVLEDKQWKVQKDSWKSGSN